MTFRASSGGWGRSPGRMGSSGRVAVTDAQIATIFAATPGTKLWLDPSDPTTRFQDFAGTTPITSDGQSFQRLGDKAGGSVFVGQSVSGNSPIFQTSSGLSWVKPDGVNDFWQSSSNIDLAATDKITLIIATRKETDSFAAIISELSPTSSTNDGSFSLFSPSSAATSTVAFLSKGTTSKVAETTSVIAPRSFVGTCIGDISGPLVSLRVNQGTTNALNTTQGTGNFGAFPLFLFSRGGTSLFYSGSLYGLMLFSRLLSPSELALCQQYMAQKIGITL